MTLQDAVGDSARAALARGDLLAAYDDIKQAREQGHEGLKYLEVLTLARLGGVDALSLKARLLKDQAFGEGLPSGARVRDQAWLLTERASTAGA